MKKYLMAHMFTLSFFIADRDKRRVSKDYKNL